MQIRFKSCRHKPPWTNTACLYDRLQWKAPIHKSYFDYEQPTQLTVIFLIRVTYGGRSEDTGPDAVCSLTETVTNSLYWCYLYGFKLTTMKINAACWSNQIRMAQGSLRLSCCSFAEINTLFVGTFSPEMLKTCSQPLQVRGDVWASNSVSQ